MDTYYCEKCKRNHKKSSKVGKNHFKFKKKKGYFYCKKCDKMHKKSSKIGKKHNKGTKDLEKSVKKIDSILKKMEKEESKYYCLKCKKKHRKSSKVGKKHKKYRASKKSYYCIKCKRRHKKSSKVGKKHKKYKIGKEKVKKDSKKEKKKYKKAKISKKKKIGFLKNLMNKFKKKEEKRQKKEKKRQKKKKEKEKKKSKKEEKKKAEEKKESEKKKKPKKFNNIVKSVLVEDVMVRNPVSINQNQTLSRAFELLERYRLRSLVVVNDENNPTGVIDEENILSYFSSFVEMKEGELTEKKEELDELSKNKVKAAMVKLHHFVEKTDSLEQAISIMNSYNLDQIPVLNKKGKLTGSLLEEDILAFIEKNVSKEETVGKDVLVTGIDNLLSLINSRKTITSKKAAEELDISVSEVEKWARILKEHGLIDIDFSTVGAIKLIKKEKETF